MYNIKQTIYYKIDKQCIIIYKIGYNEKELHTWHAK